MYLPFLGAVAQLPCTYTCWGVGDNFIKLFGIQGKSGDRIHTWTLPSIPSYFMMICVCKAMPFCMDMISQLTNWRNYVVRCYGFYFQRVEIPEEAEGSMPAFGVKKISTLVEREIGIVGIRGI